MLNVAHNEPIFESLNLLKIYISAESVDVLFKKNILIKHTFVF